MNYTLIMPSLKHIAIVKIAIALWNQRDIRFRVKAFYFPSLSTDKKQEKWQKIEDKVIKIASNLSLPESLKEELFCFIKPIGQEIMKWKEHATANLTNNLNQCDFAVQLNLLKEVYWTPHGTVDKKKTAAILIKDENIDITRRFRLACIYCLEDGVRELWNLMSQNQKMSFYNNGQPDFFKENGLAVFWTYDIKGELAKLNELIMEIKGREMPPYQFAFEYAAGSWEFSGYKEASEYFLRKLILAEREESLVISAKIAGNRVASSCLGFLKFPDIHPDVLCFLLSQMNEEQRAEIFQTYTYEILVCLLEWPWQSFFMETANCLWAFLSRWHFEYVLRAIINKVKCGYKDYNYKILFREFWQQSPNSYKNYVTGSVSSEFLLDLFKIEHEENVRLILKCATVEEREKIIFCYGGERICESLIRKNKWDSLEFFARECISSADLMIKFKKGLQNLVSRLSKETLEIEKNMCDKFFQLLDDLIQII